MNTNNNLTINTSIKDIPQTNTEFKEIEIKVIEKSFWQKYKVAIISNYWYYDFYFIFGNHHYNWLYLWTKKEINVVYT